MVSLRINIVNAILRKVIAILTSDGKMICSVRKSDFFRTEKMIFSYGKVIFPYGKVIFPYGKVIFSVRKNDFSVRKSDFSVRKNTFFRMKIFIADAVVVTIVDTEKLLCSSTFRMSMLLYTHHNIFRMENVVSRCG